MALRLWDTNALVGKFKYVDFYIKIAYNICREQLFPAEKDGQNIFHSYV